MRIKIISDGIGRNTKVVNAETGELVENVCGIKWEIHGNKSLAKAEIEFDWIAIEAEAGAEFFMSFPPDSPDQGDQSPADNADNSESD